MYQLIRKYNGTEKCLKQSCDPVIVQQDYQDRIRGRVSNLPFGNQGFNFRAGTRQVVVTVGEDRVSYEVISTPD